MIRIPSLALAGSLLLPAALPAQSAFEGAVTMKITTPDGTGMTPIVHVKGGRSHMEMATGGMTMYQIVDLDKETMMMVMPAQRMYMTINMKDALAMAPPEQVKRANAQVVIEPTGRKETIAGIECQVYHLSQPEEKTDADLCLARGMGTFLGFSGGASGRGAPGGAGMPPAFQKLAKRFPDGAFVLKMIVREGGQLRMTMEVTRIEKKSVDESMFAPPVGFQQMDMSGMMRRPPGKP